MSTVYRLHAEIAGAVVAAGGTVAQGAGAEGFSVTPDNKATYGTSSPAPPSDIHGNGGTYFVTGSDAGAGSGSDFALNPYFGDLVMTNVPEALVRFSICRKSGANRPAMVGIGNGATNGDLASSLVRLKFDQHGSLEIHTRELNQNILRATVANATPVDTWKTYWLYYRFSTVSGTTAQSDGRVILFDTDPHLGGGNSLFDFSGEVYWRQGTGAQYPALADCMNHSFYDINAHFAFDDIVCHHPTMQYMGDNGIYPSVGDVIKYTDGSGNVTQAKVCGLYQFGIDPQGKSNSRLQLHHMTYTPSGGSAVDFDGVGFGNVDFHQAWGQQGGNPFVTITDPSNNTIGAGAIDQHSQFPRTGYFTPVAKPSQDGATPDAIKSDVNQTYSALLGDIGGVPSESTYVYANAQNQQVTMQFDQTGGSANTPLEVVGDPSIIRVETYIWSKQSGTGGSLTGQMSHISVAQSNTINARTQAHPAAQLGPNYGVSIREHFRAPPPEGGQEAQWTVALVNSSNFGVEFD